MHSKHFCMDLLYSKQPCPHYETVTCIHTHIILTFTRTHNNGGGLIHLLGLSLTHTHVHSVYDTVHSIDTWRNAT